MRIILNASYGNFEYGVSILKSGNHLLWCIKNMKIYTARYLTESFVENITTTGTQCIYKIAYSADYDLIWFIVIYNNEEHLIWLSRDEYICINDISERPK